MLSFSPVGPSTSAITTGGSHRQISYNGSLLRVNLSSQTPKGQVFTTHNGFLYERVCCTRMYWNSSTGESDPEATALRPSNRECFLVMRRSLFLMAATILSSEPWCVLIEYRWQPGTEVEEMQIKRHYLRCVVHWRCPNNGCRQPLQRSKHLVWDRFSHISWSVKINLKELCSLKGAPLKQQFFSGVQLIPFFIVCENLKIQHEGSGSCTLVKDNIQVLSLLWQQNNKIEMSSVNHHLFPVRVEMSGKNPFWRGPLIHWIICVDLRTLLYLQLNLLTQASRLNTVNREYFTFL